ncbi:MAG: hypothetical protein R6U19_09035 [Bacteroidales bacterium]
MMSRICAIIVFLLLYIYPVQAKQTDVKRHFSREDYTKHLDSLRDEFGINKEIHEEYELETLLALSYFPELKDIHIIFKPRYIKTTMAAIPRIDAIFSSRTKRTYHIFINKFIEDSSSLNFDSVPFNARIGLIGHELGHIIDYQEKSSVRIMANGLAYVFNSSFRKTLEAKVDQITIEHGLGWQLYDFVNFLYNEAAVEKKYLHFKILNYPKPDNYKTWLSEYPDLYDPNKLEKTFSDNE